MKKEEKMVFKWETEKLKSLQNRNTIFMWFSAVSSFLLLAFALYYKNRILAVGIILASAIVYSLKKVEPKTFPVEINEKGISVYNRLFKYKRIQQFYFVKNYNKNYLLFVSKQHAIFLTHVILIEPHIDIEQVRSYLLKFIEEKEIDTSFLDMIFE